MIRLVKAIETMLFASRWLLVPVYLAMVALLAMLVAYFIGELIHAVPAMAAMSENDLIILTLSLIDLSLVANLVVLIILSGYENFISNVMPDAGGMRPAWMSRISFTGLKLKLLGSITVIAAIHLLRSVLELDQQSSRSLAWQVGIVMVFALLGLILAYTDKLGDETH